MAEATFIPAGPGNGTPNIESVATRTALAALVGAVDGQEVTVLSDNSKWRYNALSTAAADATAPNAVTGANIVVVPGDSIGRWIRADKAFTMRLPFAFGTADGAILHTVPVGFAWRLTGMPYWDISTGLTGDATTTIGVSSSNLAGDFTVKGDILGGALGNTIAQLGAGSAIVTAGTPGDAWTDADTANTSLSILAGLMPNASKTIRFDIITPGTGLTAGAGMVCLPVSLETAAGTLIS